MEQTVKDILNPLAFIQEETNIAKVTQSALGYAQPMMLPFKHKVVVLDQAVATATDPAIEAKSHEALSQLGDTFFQCKVSFDKDGSIWDLPVDPLVSVSNRNVIKRRYVSKSKMRGSIKECWSQDDCEITIAGVLLASDKDELNTMIGDLRNICEKAEAVDIYCDFLNKSFGINKIAVESCDFPFTKGIENQSFTIKAYSDDGYSLLEEV